MVLKGIAVLSWFPLTIILLLLNLSLLSSSNTQTPQTGTTSYITSPQVIPDASSSQILGIKIVAADARGLLLKSFLKEHNSPMLPYADYIIEAADSHGFDFRLVPAIAMCESNLGKRIPGGDSYNPFGIAVYTGQLTGMKFRNWQHAIDWVSDFIETKFYNQGITNIYDIGAIWAPPSVESNNSWANCVLTFLEELQ